MGNLYIVYRRREGRLTTLILNRGESGTARRIFRCTNYLMWAIFGYTNYPNAGGCVRPLIVTALLDPSIPNVAKISFRDTVQMLFTGKALTRLQQLMDERELHIDLDDHQAGLRVVQKFGTLTQLWEEFQGFEDENPVRETLLDWYRTSANPPYKGWHPPFWQGHPLKDD